MTQQRFPSRPFGLARRPRASRWAWLRLFNTFPDHPKWGLVATEAGCSRAVAIATAAKLLTVANKGHSRGSVEDFEPAEWAATLGVDRGEVDRVLAVLERRGWITQSYLVTWDEHQPDDEDPTRYERVRRFREKKRQARRGEAEARLALNSSSAPQSETPFQQRETHFTVQVLDQPAAPPVVRNGVSTVSETLRADTESKPADEAEALAWLYAAGPTEGLYLVMRGCARGSELYARNRIREWLIALGEDADALVRILRAIAGQASGAAYEHLVEQHVATARDLAAGSPRLPLPPRPVKLSGA
jgi:hypothetical protein